MRISDWSSDVCSSDLFVHAQLISPLDLIAERVVAEYLPAFLDQCRVARRQARVGPCIDRADRSGQQCNAAGNQHRERLHLEFHRVTLRRSEEHTSALPSLKRHSYADFSMKKKKQTTYTTTS